MHNLYDIKGVKLGKIYLPTSFSRRYLQGRRSHRFISVCELCL